MNVKQLLKCLPFLIIGIYMIVRGLSSRELISESDMPATEDEKTEYKATTGRRVLVVLGGVVSIIYSLFCLRS
jgi:hypothetical protein